MSTPATSQWRRLFGSGPRAVLARGASAAFVLQGLGALLGFVLQVALARWMSVRDYGSYAYVFAWATLLAVPIGLGFPGTMLRFVSAYAAQSDRGRLRGVVRAGSLVVAASGLAFGLLGTGVVLVLASAGAIGRTGPALAGVWLAPVLALALLQQEISRAWRRMTLAFAPGFVLRPLAIIVGAWIVFRTHGPLSSTEGLLVTLAAAAAVLAGQRVRLGSLTRAATGGEAPVVELRRWGRVAFPLLLTALFITLMRQTDVLMVGSILDARDTAFYNAASKTALLVSFVLVATNGMAAPLFAALYASGDREALQRLATTVARVTFWPSLAFAVGLAALGGPVLRLFGGDFDAARWPLVVLVAGQLVNAATGSVGYLLTLTGHQDDTARVYGAVALANLALVPLGVVAFGLVGAAIATALSTVAWNVWLHRLVVRRIGIEASLVSGRSIARAFGRG